MLVVDRSSHKEILHDKVKIMAVAQLNQHIEITPGIAGGKPHITGHRITVQDVAIWHERMGMSADEISSEYNLTLAEIYAALTYYFDYRVEIDRSIQERDAFVEDLRRRTPSRLVRKLCGEE